MELQELKSVLEKKGYEVSFFETKEEAAKYIDGAVDKRSVGIGGSVSVKEMGLFEMLKSHNTVWWHNDPEQAKEYGAETVRHKEIQTEVYISSVNGVSEQGEFVNIDGGGNRIGATCYGHDKYYYIIGKNKLAKNLEKAIWRARNIASPKNAQRLGRKTPCAVKGDKCYDCNSPERICRGLLIQWQKMAGANAEVVLVNENLGY